MKSFVKAFFMTILILLLLGGAVVAFYMYTMEHSPQIDEQTPGESVSFLLLGVDSLHSKDAENARSDTIMVANLNMGNGKVNLISIPRDTYAQIRGYNKQKINHSYKYGGAPLTLETVNRILGTNIKYYVVVDYEFLFDVVNHMGGITVDVPMDMKYDDPTATPPLHIDLKKGEQQTLNGEQAMGFLRFRKGYAMQDLDRVKTQQQFMSAMLSQIKKPSILLKIPVLYSSFRNNTENNLPTSLLIKMATAMRKVHQDSVTATTLPGKPQYIHRVSYFIHDEKETKKIVEQMGIH